MRTVTSRAWGRASRSPISAARRARTRRRSTPADFERRILAGSNACAKAGLPQVQDASHYGPEQIAALAKLADSSALPIRIYATVANEAASLAGFFAKGPRIGRGSDFL